MVSPAVTSLYVPNKSSVSSYTSNQTPPGLMIIGADRISMCGEDDSDCQLFVILLFAAMWTCSMDFQLTMGQFAAVFEEAGIRNSIAKSEARILQWETVDYWLR